MKERDNFIFERDLALMIKILALLEDCVLENQALKHKIRKPFDILVSNPKDNSWLNIQPNDLPKYRDLEKEI